MIIELQSIEVHESIRVHKKNQNGITTDDAKLTYLPYLGIVILRPKYGLTKVVSFTNIRSAVPINDDAFDDLIDKENARFPAKKGKKAIRLGNP